MGKKNAKGPEAFMAHYAELFGPRWESLKKALLAPQKYVAWTNPFVSSLNSLDFLQTPFIVPGSFIGDNFPKPSLTTEGVFNYYLLDGASLIPPLALQVQENDRVLDMCAAPGGKSLAILAKLGPGGHLTSNELSAARRTRLKSVFESYVPSNLRERYKITGHDGGSWCLYEKDRYDKVLVDAPCSSERHLLQDPKHLKQWGIGRSKKLAQIQFTLLSSAIQVVRPGGRVVYSTCALSPLENDKIIERLIERRREQVQLVQEELPLGEKTPFGQLILPDQEGLGPIYLSILKRII